MKQYIFLLFVLWVCSINAQTVTVLDMSSRRPIESVQVSTSSDAFMALTNADGLVRLSEVPEGTTLYFSTIGYLAVAITLDSIQKNPIVMMRAKSYDMDEVVISASRFEESKRDVAQSISVITKSDIDYGNQRSTADLLESTGDVFVQRSQFGGGSPVIRGFEASRVLLVVDGVRMNNAIYRAGHLQNIISMDQGMVDRVEIAYGPGSVVYGSDALGGVVHFYTRAPRFSIDDSLRVEVNAYSRYGTAADEVTGHLDLNLGKKKFASLTSITYSQYGDLKTGSVHNPFYGGFGFRPVYADRMNDMDTVMVNADSSLQVGTAYEQLDVMQKFSIRQTNQLLHSFNIQFSKSSDIPRYDRLTESGSGGLGLKYAEWYYGPQVRWLAAYQMNYTKANKLFDQARFLTNYQWVEESRNDRRFDSNDLHSRTELVQVIGFNLDLEKRIGEQELRYGLETYLNDIQSKANQTDIVSGEVSGLDTRYPDGGSTMNAYSVYLTHTWEMNEHWILNDGIRLNATHLNAQFQDTTFFPFPYTEINQENSAVTGSIGLIYLPVERWRFSIMGSTGYRTPNVDDVSKVFDSEPGRVMVPNPDLTPEYTYNVDLHITHAITDQAQADMTVWATSFRNALTVLPGSFNGQDSIEYNGELSEVVQLSNAGKAYLYGVTGSLQADVNRFLSFSTGLSYTYGRITTDTVSYPQDHIPPVYGRSSLDLRLNKFRGTFAVLYNGWKRIEDYNIIGGEDNEQYATPYGMPAWYTLNLKASYSLSNTWTLQGGIDNLTDLHYRVFASGVSAPGRNVYLTVRAFM